MFAKLFDWAKFSGKVVGVMGLSVVVLFYIFQDNMLYIPNPPGFPANPDLNPAGFQSPREWGRNGRPARGSPGIPFEDTMLTTKDGEKIHVWLLLQPNSSTVPTLVYFHGNAGNMGFRLENAARMYADIGINILMVDYRGYGKKSPASTTLIRLIR